MSRFIESIKLHNGVFFRLALHQQRMQKAQNLFYPEKEKINLYRELEKQPIPKNGLFKCRIVFSDTIEQIEFLPYRLPEVHSLKIVETTLETTLYKSFNRIEINRLFAQKGDCDDILLVKNDFVMDTSYCNVAFYDGKNFFTPEIPLIYGVQRAELLADKKIKEKQIKTEEIHSFQSVYLFNAMIELGEIVVNTENIMPSFCCQ